jgi:hypothetical protein
MSMVSREGPLLFAMKSTRRAWWSAAMLLIRSRTQRPVTTWNLSRDGPHLGFMSEDVQVVRSR